MVSDSAKTAFLERVSKLRINPDALDEVRVHVPRGRETGIHTVPNSSNTKNSLAIYAHATSNDGYITPSSAENALGVYGDEYQIEAANRPGQHPNIDVLVDILRREEKVRADVIRKDSHKPIPGNIRGAINRISSHEPTPFYVYDAQGIVYTTQQFTNSFSWVPGGFRNYFAVKALPNLKVLEILKCQGSGFDCSSMPELELARMAGVEGSRIMFTSNDTPKEEFRRARELDAIINLDDITHIDRLIESVGKNNLPDIICFRYNPGPLKSGNEIIGDPREAKYGLTTEQIPEAYKRMRDLGVKKFGLHTMVVSNMLDEEYLIDTGGMVFELGEKLQKDLGIKFNFFNLGGGVGTPYKPEQIPVDLNKVSEGIKKAYFKTGFGVEGNSPKVVMECGRAITGPHGYLVSEVAHVTSKYKEFVGLDASMANLMRPGMYGAYHHISVLGKEDSPKDHVYDVTGSLCENNDKFAVNRALPEIKRGDVVVIHNGGAHASAMCFQYNGKLRGAEFLAFRDHYVKARRAETFDDYITTQKEL